MFRLRRYCNIIAGSVVPVIATVTFVKNDKTLMTKLDENHSKIQRSINAVDYNMTKMSSLSYRYDSLKFMASKFGLTTFCDSEQNITTKKYANGDVYTGEFSSELRNGHGKMIYKNGGVYEGEWKDDKRHGNGTSIELFEIGVLDRIMAFITGDELDQPTTYTGEFKDDMCHGHGVLTNTSDGSVVYSGQWSKDTFHGLGTLTMVGIGTYTGQFLANDIHGRGKLVYENGSVYEGNFQDNKRHGFDGRYTLPDGVTVCQCQWRDGSPLTTGVITFGTTGDVYSGEIKDFMIADSSDNGGGNNTMFYSNGSEYSGSFLNGLQHGKGRLTYPDGGTVYSGHFVRGELSGLGVLRNKDGSQYEGEFVQSKRHGKGVYTDKEGFQFNCEFRENELVV